MIRVDPQPCDAYAAWQRASGAFFDSGAWGEVLRAGFGATPWFAWDDEAQRGHLIAMFRRGPATMGYLGFPVCAAPGADDAEYPLQRMVDAIARQRPRPQVLRLPLSAFSREAPPAGGRTRTTLETCAEDLSRWNAEGTSTRRRDLALARRRSGDFATMQPDGAALHALYHSAVRRNRGSLRYTRAYFERLVRCPGVRVHARAENGRPVGMAIVARHGDTAYYLHAGTDPKAMGTGLADLLVCEAMAAAVAEGARRFDFLSSPAAQPGLVRFKEKWGGQTRKAISHDIPMGWIGTQLMRWI
jgi:hypothetical protein